MWQGEWSVKVHVDVLHAQSNTQYLMYYVFTTDAVPNLLLYVAGGMECPDACGRAACAVCLCARRRRQRRHLKYFSTTNKR
jgi:hypothetical protein